jgi:hypothetical protein
MWVQVAYFLVMAVVSAAISYALAPKPKKAQPPSAQNITSPTVDAGTPIQKPFGTMTIKGPNTVDWGGDRTEEVKR